MSFAEKLRIALRYSFAFGRGHLSTFLSSLSMLGLVLAITLLITVLSVMNGFDREMRERILSLVPHITLQAHQGMSDWRARIGPVLAHPDVVAVRPFVQFNALFMQGRRIETAQGLGVVSSGEMGALLTSIGQDALIDFMGTPNGLVLGRGLAERLAVQPGDSLTLIVPGQAKGERASATRFVQVQLCGVLDTGTELDESVALVDINFARGKLSAEGAVSGLQVETSDLFDVARIGWELVQNLPPGYYATNWMQTHGNLYAAIQLSRDLVSILLFSIIAVAAFNVVSSLVLVVFDKQGDIAILRTLGASGGDIGWVFVLQGAVIGLVGAVLGCLFGIGLALAVPTLVEGLERLLNYRFLSTDVYPVSFLPVDVLASDVLLVGGVAWGMCVLAALYPALRAARLAPARILHQDA
ncbi:lipoprotein-releasing ABC transporter permease subunit [Parahaliea mediterranea]|uniref:lipoprotein-releasing ABC transporter permease subunit n=1 Tax=Parahaliea mediterranea TaxID=651086 RepID=UPI000E2F3993|nr:lipoprotein-releasing ABC transporter permease subunit [Parahaliea mediterranea]